MSQYTLKYRLLSKSIALFLCFTFVGTTNFSPIKDASALTTKQLQSQSYSGIHNHALLLQFLFLKLFLFIFSYNANSQVMPLYLQDPDSARYTMLPDFTQAYLDTFDFSQNWALDSIRIEEVWEETTGAPYVHTGIFEVHNSVKPDSLLFGKDVYTLGYYEQDPEYLIDHASAVLSVYRSVSNTPAAVFSNIKELHKLMISGIDIMNVSFSLDKLFSLESKPGLIGINDFTHLGSFYQIPSFVSMGNDGEKDNIIYPPAIWAPLFSHLFSVGALDQNWLSPSWATRDASMSFAYPGEGIFTMSQHLAALKNGTSFSSPLLTGVVSLMLSKNPHLTTYDINQILQRSSHQPEDSIEIYGNGIPNAALAYELTPLPERMSVIASPYPASTHFETPSLEFHLGYERPETIKVLVQKVVFKPNWDWDPEPGYYGDYGVHYEEKETVFEITDRRTIRQMYRAKQGRIDLSPFIDEPGYYLVFLQSSYKGGYVLEDHTGFEILAASPATGSLEPNQTDILQSA